MMAMDELWQVVAEIGLQLHPDRIAVLASRIESLDSVEQITLVRSVLDPHIHDSLVARLAFAWQDAVQVSPSALAASLRGASAAATLCERRGSMELVWTGPLTGIVPVRHTEQVLCEVIESARDHLFMVSFIAYEVQPIIKALREACNRKVRIDMLLESSTERGGTTTTDSIRTMKDAVPSANVYAWRTADEGKGLSAFTMGSVHAKCAVADRTLAFITSANLSVAAMERNMEIGILVRGGHLPDQLHRHLDALVATRIVEGV